MKNYKLIAIALSVLAIGPTVAFAASPLGQTPAPLDQVLATAQAQRDPLAAMAQAGYQPGSEEYEAVANTIAEHIPANSPYFTQDVNNQVAVMSESEGESLTD